MAKDVLITPASGKLEVKASNGTTVETKIEDGNIVLTGTLSASGYNDSNWNSRTNLQGSLRRILWDAPTSSPTPPGPEPDPDDPTALSPGVLLLAQAGGGLIFRPGNGISIKKLI